MRAMTRNPAKANFPEGVEVVYGDLASPESLVPALRGVTSMHLITFNSEGFGSLQTGPEIVELAKKAGVERVTVLWNGVNGHEVLTIPEKVRTISEAIGKDIRFVELTEDQARERMRIKGAQEDVIDFVIGWHANPPKSAYTVVPTVEQVTGRPARTSAEWVSEHVQYFTNP